jgi:hypothetical protein
MNVRWTWLLTGGALGLGLFVFLTERKGGVRVTGSSGAAPYVPMKAADVTAVEFIRSNSVVRVERSAEAWRMREPVTYPAQATAIEALLSALERMQPRRWMSLKEVGGPEALKGFGLDSSAPTLTLESVQGPWLLRIGSQTPLGDQFYFQRVGLDGVFTGDGKVFNLIPTSAAAWRDRNLVDLRDLSVDRFELRRKTTIEAVRDPVTRQWRLVKPLAGRANSDRINGLITTLQMTPVTAFVTDSPFVDLETFGFQSPEAEVLLGAGDRTAAQLQFGRVATNAPGQMYVRRLSHTNIVLVPTPISVLLQAPLAEFRDRRLLSTDLDVTRIEFQLGTNQALAERKGTNWTIVQPGPYEADPVEVGYLLGGLAALRIRDFPSAGVADYGRYGLNPPAFLVRLSSGTNSPLELQFSAPTGADTVYARRGDEPGVYDMSWPEVEALPKAVGQLRSVTFSPTQLLKVTVHQAGHERVLERASDGGWKVASGEPGNLLAPALDETIYRLGHLATRRWLVLNEAQLTNLPSARELAHEVVFHFSPGAPLRTLRWRIVSVNEVAAVVLVYMDDDSHPVGREIPGGLYEDFRREFSIP